jgi:putative flippase GtrA
MSQLKKHKTLIQFIEYLISGGAFFWIGYAAFAYFWSVLHWSLWWSTITSNLIGWIVNYILQRYWVFSNKKLKSHQTSVTGRYIFITLVDFLLNYFILYGLKQAGISPYIGQFISSGFFTGWNWFWYKFWVFPDKFTKKKTIITPARVIAHRSHGHSAFHRSAV